MASGSRRASRNPSAVEAFYGRRTSVYRDDPEEDSFSPPDRRKDSVADFFGHERRPSSHYSTHSTPYRDDPAEHDHADHDGSGQPPRIRRDSYAYEPSTRSQPRAKTPAVDDEDDKAGFDIYADFNNAGPRYSGAPPFATMGGKDGYKSLGTPSGSKVALSDLEMSEGPGGVELVTVPRFGPEWTKDELNGMTKTYQAEERAYKRKQRWKEWNQGGRGWFGSKWLTRQALVWIIFVSIIIVVICLAVFIPRVPTFAFNPNSPLTAPTGSNVPTPVFTRGPTANFTFDAVLDLEMNTGGNVIPLWMNELEAKVYIVDTNTLVAEGKTGGFWRAANDIDKLNLPITFNYWAGNDSDPTWNIVYNACKSSSLYATGSRSTMNIGVVLDMYIRGIIGKRSTSTAIPSLACPIQLPSNE